MLPKEKAPGSLFDKLIPSIETSPEKVLISKVLIKITSMPFFLQADKKL